MEADAKRQKLDVEGDDKVETDDQPPSDPELEQPDPELVQALTNLEGIQLRLEQVCCRISTAGMIWLQVTTGFSVAVAAE